jgi:hypothetical protein
MINGSGMLCFLVPGHCRPDAIPYLDMRWRCLGHEQHAYRTTTSQVTKRRKEIDRSLKDTIIEVSTLATLVSS